jgi:CheY-like chemotaxis protein
LHVLGTVNAPLSPTVLIATPDAWLSRLLQAAGYRALTAWSGIQARNLAAGSLADVAVIAPTLADMSGLEACRLLATDPSVPRHLPILMEVEDAPDPELRVDALRSGVWDFVSRSAPNEAVLHKVASYVAAHRSFAELTSAGIAHGRTEAHTRLGLATRVREIASLMARVRQGFACIVVEVGNGAPIPDLPNVVTTATRVSDAGGTFGLTRTGVVAPATGADGAVRLAARIANSVRDAIRERGYEGADDRKLVGIGYEVVSDAVSGPGDSLHVLRNAAAAVWRGKPEPELPWIRRFTPDLIHSSLNG